MKDPYSELYIKRRRQARVWMRGYWPYLVTIVIMSNLSWFACGGLILALLAGGITGVIVALYAILYIFCPSSKDKDQRKEINRR